MIPAFLNSEAGNAEQAREILEKTGQFYVQVVAPAELSGALRKVVDAGARRILVAGGDGSIACAAAIVTGTAVELAMLPGGTLNHFARANGIPADLAEALKVAAGGQVKKADVAYVGKKLFLNTSSIGAYVTFVHVRERFEHRFGYFIASTLALGRLFSRLRTFRIQVEIDGKSRSYTTPLIFIGAGERELQMPKFGSRLENGRRGLHVIVVSTRTRARILVLALTAATRGMKRTSRTPQMDAFIVERCTIDLGRSTAGVSVDGETIAMETPLEYRIVRDALNIVVPDNAERTHPGKQVD